MSHNDELKERYNISSFVTSATTTAQTVQTQPLSNPLPNQQAPEPQTPVPLVPQHQNAGMSDTGANLMNPCLFNFGTLEEFGKSQNRNGKQLDLGPSTPENATPAMPTPVQMSLAHSHLHSPPSAESPEPPLGAMDTNEKFKQQELESFGLMTPSPFQSFGGDIGGMGMSDPR